MWGPLEEDCKKHRWVFQISFKSGFEVGFVAFATLYTAFYFYYFDLGVGLMETGKIIKRIEPDHVSQFPNLESRYERSKEVLSLFAIFWSLNFKAAINSKKSDVTPNFIYLFIFIYYSIINYTLHVRIFQFWYLKFWYS